MTAFRTNKQAPTEQKLRGGYYTPEALTDYLCRWAIRDGGERVIEPSCGDGNFVASAAALLNENGSITGVEIVPREIKRAKTRTKDSVAKVIWKCASFFDVAPSLLQGENYDVVLGNPPFIRFQHFEKDEREQAFRLLRDLGYKPTGLANVWSAFVQLSAEMLRDGGRLAMVVPAELLQVQYAAQLRERLPLLFDDVLIVAFDELVFPDIQQEVVLLLAEGRNRSRKNHGKLHTLQLLNGSELVSNVNSSLKVSHLPERHTRKGMKWTSLFLDHDQFDLLDRLEREGDLHALGSYASVDVGVITGRNSFFVINSDVAQRLELNGYAFDVVGRTSALKSIRFTKNDAEIYAESFPSKLLNLKGINESTFSQNLIKYIERGEKEQINDGYKCRVRPRWFDVPSVYVPDAFLFRQIHQAPLLVANHARMTATDTIHRVRVVDGVDTDRLCASTINSLTFAWAEVCGRSYGGGVLELEPSEAEELPVPYQHAGQVDFDYVDQKLRNGDLEAALDHTDEILLRRGCGFSKSDVALARTAWKTMRSRRQRRKQPSRASVC